MKVHGERNHFLHLQWTSCTWDKFYKSVQYGLERIPSHYSKIAHCRLIEWPHDKAYATGQKMLSFQGIRFMPFCQSGHRVSQSGYEGHLLECGKMLFSFQFHIPLQSPGSFWNANSVFTWHWERPRVKASSLTECQRISSTFYLNDFAAFVFPNLFNFVWNKSEVDFNDGISICQSFPQKPELWTV